MVHLRVYACRMGILSLSLVSCMKAAPLKTTCTYGAHPHFKRLGLPTYRARV